MKFLIITHAKHTKNDEDYLSYAPYVREMNLWLKHVDKVEIVAPLTNYKKSNIDLKYEHSNIHFNSIPEIEFTSLFKAIVSVFKTPVILFRISQACFKADHIHLRCPGNVGLLGCIVQFFFPSKTKTAKYAGNWDPNSKQPLSYRIQKKILSNTFLTKKMQVLVYGDWKNQTKNVLPFFTATYQDEEIEPIIIRDYSNTIKFLFVGSLVDGKRPLFTIQTIEALYKKGLDVKLDIYGEGALKKSLQEYIVQHELESIITIHGNVKKSELKLAYKSSHFLMLLSKSEGWPKAIAESMFFGVIPIATKISCVGWMLDNGRRGILIENDFETAGDKIYSSIKNDNLASMSIACGQWSQNYTLDVFEQEIIKLVQAK